MTYGWLYLDKMETMHVKKTFSMYIENAVNKMGKTT